ncbi:hypothetical protein [Aliikangiella sp. IMCC44359]|uniref:hypothetical protein n=1 Tax=Aliikangiella sp. IMCC44359 TaxID=3459125 RepID=UPI00403A7D4D
MNNQVIEYQLIWNGITIEITHTHKRWGVIEHLDIRVIEPEDSILPITNTGYKSHHIDESYLAEFKSPVEYVQEWLEYEAKQPKWKRYQEESRQYSLF